jgi:hypothetical protein
MCPHKLLFKFIYIYMHVCQLSSSIPVRSTESCNRQRKAGAVHCPSASMVPYQCFSTGCSQAFSSSSSLKRKTKGKGLGTLQQKLPSFRDIKRKKKMFFLSSSKGCRKL